MQQTSVDRLPGFVAQRVARMTQTPFTFYRGSADLMAIDLQGTPTSGLLTTAIGDAHLTNFGFYASPERQLVMDVNDFDQSHPGPWEWDLKRLAASLVIAGRGNGLTDETNRDIVQQAAQRYAIAMGRTASKGVLAYHLEVVTVDHLREGLKRTALKREIEIAEKKARRKTSASAILKLTESTEDGRYRIIESPPNLVAITDDNADIVGTTAAALTTALDTYVETLPYEWQRVLQSYSVEDVAYRLTGVGSAGMRTYIALLVGNGRDDVVFLQLKQAGPSVLAGRTGGPTSRHRHDGKRVVMYQMRSQTVSDPLLGWTSLGDHEFYVRQLRDMKGDVPVTGLDEQELSTYGQLCAALLARAHARSGDAASISGYLGTGTELGEAIAEFAVRYADQAQVDWQRVKDAAQAGLLPLP